MTVKHSVQKLSRKGIWVAAATLWRASAATAVHCRIFSRESKDLGTIVDSGKVLNEISISWDV
jgi:hypothetical protein